MKPAIIKRSALLLALACVLALLGAPRASAANQVADIRIKAALQDDGAADITQTWTATTDEGTEFYLACRDNGYLSITDFTGSDEQGTYEPLASWDVGADFTQKARKCGVVETGEGVELCWGISEYGTHTYTLRYPLHGLVGAYDAADGFTSEPLRLITREMLDRFREKLLYYPAAQRIHHAERGGLLHHTTGMLRLAKAILTQYTWLNADLLLAGVILHDLCKTEEMDSNDMGVVRDYSREGLLLGHLVLGVNRIQEAANELGISGEPVLLLQHMMLSHHGEAEFGSPRKPMFPEAEALHWVDLLDARMNEMQTAVQKLKPGVFSEKIWSLDRRLYRADYDALGQEEPEMPPETDG